MIGTRLGHFAILELVGSGGMGDVYKAWDESLERHVAIKVIRGDLIANETMRRRFLHEAHALSKLNHPNIQTVHALGSENDQDYLVVELLSGASLRDRLTGRPAPESEVVHLGIELASALETAHAHSIIHRDMKPENIRILPDGRAKLIDFGLAQQTVPGATTVPALTGEHNVIGTLAYLSPEQLGGARASERSDLYALGVVLHELATGRRPHDENSPAQLIHAIAHESVTRPSRFHPGLSSGLETVLRKLLERDPKRRYGAAGDLRADLERLQAGTAPSIRSSPGRTARRALAALGVLAVVGAIGFVLLRTRSGEPGKRAQVPLTSLGVLPFENLSRNPELEYLADGLTDELAVQVARNAELRVVARASTMQFKGTSKALHEIGRDLHATVLVTGSVLPAGDSLGFRVQLIDAKSQKLLWGESHTATLANIAALQDQIARSIWKVLGLALPSEAQASARSIGPASREAHDAYLRGRYYFHQYTKQGFERALAEFQRAIRHDPLYAAAHAGLADCYWGASEYFLSADVAMPRARAAAEEALRLDADLADAHAALGTVYLMYEWNFRLAEQHFQRALELNPSDASAHQQYGMFLVSQGRFAGADSEMANARKLDPLSPMVGAVSLWPPYLNRKYAQTIRIAREQLGMGSDAPPLARHVLGLALVEAGRTVEGLAEIEAGTRQDSSAFGLATLGYGYSRAGRRADAQRIVRELEARVAAEYLPGYELATLHAGLGEPDEAMRWLERAREAHSGYMTIAPFDPRLDPLRKDPRFARLLAQVKAP